MRSVEALALYVIINDQIRTSELTPITDNIFRPRLCNLINSQKTWKAITDKDNVDKLFRNFDYSDGGGDDSGATNKRAPWTNPNPHPLQGIYALNPDDEAGQPGAS